METEAVGQLARSFMLAREAKLQKVVDSGVALDRISIQVRKYCDECGGTGSVLSTDTSGSGVTLWLTECSLCPGICVDGKPASDVAREMFDAALGRMFDAAEAEGHRVWCR